MMLPDIQWFTLGMQCVILIIQGWSAANAVKGFRAAMKTQEVIDAYRREIGWLTVRIELMERQKGPIHNEEEEST